MFIDEIKQVTSNVIDSMQLTDYVYGEVLTLNPLSIKIDQKITVSGETIILTANVIEKKINIEHTHAITDGFTGTETPTLNEVIIVEGLAVGDKVLVLRVGKGQKFIVLSKM